jgi:arginyl-tRNA synthetase
VDEISSRSTATPLEDLREVVLDVAAGLAAGDGTAPVGVTLERPPRVDFGDYSTNAALLLAPALGTSPREVAQRLGDELGRRLGEDLERFEVAGPGFVNLFLDDRWHRRALAGALAAGERFGRAGAPAPERVLIEFVSANPTGPMHVGHARNAAYGDALGRLLAFHGHRVTREFYVNDAGSQVRKLGESIRAVAAGEPVPEDGYRGDYVGPLAAEVLRSLAAAGGAGRREEDAERATDSGTADPADVPDTADGADSADAPNSADLTALGEAAVRIMVARMRTSLEGFGVRFDEWRYETELHRGAPSPVEHALALLAEQGRTYRSAGALWLRTTESGDDKDRVLVRSNGEHTYFASDIAYHEAKRAQRFDRLIDVWGADHHGYVGRMRAAYRALGGDPESLELIIMQLVHLVRRGRRAQMSKRAGEFVTLDDLLAEIGVDAARWFLLSRSHDTTIDLDLDLAREQSNENPVYYVQYAHARSSSVLAKAGSERVAEALTAMASERVAAALGGRDAGVEGAMGVEGAKDAEGAQAEPLHPSERALIKRLLAFPGEVEEAARRRAAHRIAAYALELAQDFTAFYRDCHVVGAEPAAVESLRIALSVAARDTIARCLEDLLGVEAPQEM